MEIRKGDKVRLLDEAYYPVKKVTIPVGAEGVVTSTYYDRWSQKIRASADFEGYDVHGDYALTELERIEQEEE